MRLGFAGLGRMGLPMAENLLRSGHQLTVWNRTPSRCQPAVERGARVAGTPAQLAAASEIVITMLEDAAALEEVLAGRAGLVDGIEPGSLVVDMSTIGPVAAGPLAGIASRHGAGFVDAPVSGSVPSAESGALLTMVGGTEEQFARVRPVLAAMTSQQIHVGPSGAGTAMKIALNIMIAATSQAVAETLLLAGHLGIDRARAYQVLESSAVSSAFAATSGTPSSRARPARLPSPSTSCAQGPGAGAEPGRRLRPPASRGPGSRSGAGRRQRAGPWRWRGGRHGRRGRRTTRAGGAGTPRSVRL